MQEITENANIMQVKSLLNRLTDLSKLAELPKDGEKSGTFSSYDRSSQYDPENDQYIEWAANDDGDGIIRIESDENVVVEIDGPGVIWRIWSAQPENGNINFYFDGEETPSYSRPFKQFFEQISDDVSPSGFPSLMPKLSGGYNSFLPIPFNKGIKITFSKEWGKYYHFTYSKVPSDEILPNFSDLLSKEGLIAIAELDRKLYARGESFLDNKFLEDCVIPKGSDYTIKKNGAGVINYLGFEFDHESYTPTDLEELLRNTLLIIYWDQEENPSVSVPIGDFFGTAPGYNKFKTLVNGISEKRMYAKWYMPYSEGFKIVLDNQSNTNLSCRLVLNNEELSKTHTDTLLRFHAKWHNGDFLNRDEDKFQKGEERWPDWPLLLLNGKGRFCGVHMHVFDTWIDPQLESDKWWYGQRDNKTIDWWWGEGDEKFFVDGEKFPSTFGTGSEDYIGYAWAAEPPFALFDSAYAVQSRMPVNGNGHTSVMRLQVCDNVPFNKSFEGFIEKYKDCSWNGKNTCIYEVTPFWYQERETNDYYSTSNADDRNATLLDKQTN